MSLVNGHCDNEFDAVRAAFEAQLESGEELGGSVAITVDGESVVDLWGGYADESRTTHGAAIPSSTRSPSPRP